MKNENAKIHFFNDSISIFYLKDRVMLTGFLTKVGFDLRGIIWDFLLPFHCLEKMKCPKITRLIVVISCLFFPEPP